MQISTTVKPAAASKPAQSQSSCAMERPDHESWYVGDAVYHSTQELLDAHVVTEKGVKAVYNYQEQSELDRDVWKEVPGRVLKGAAGGALGGLAFGAAVEVVGGALNLLTLGGLGFEHGALTLMPIVGAGLGALIGPLDAFETHGNYKEFGANIEGALVKSYNSEGQEQINFHPESSLEESINVGEFAKGPIHVDHPESECKPWWKDRGYTPNPG